LTDNRRTARLAATERRFFTNRRRIAQGRKVEFELHVGTGHLRPEICARQTADGTGVPSTLRATGRHRDGPRARSERHCRDSQPRCDDPGRRQRPVERWLLVARARTLAAHSERRPDRRNPIESHHTMYRYLVLTTRTPQFLPSVVPEHYAFLDRLRQEGKLELSGPFTDQSGGAYLIKAASLEEAKALAFSDPVHTTNSSLVTVHEWNAK
jgi:uncharacterized protein